MKAGVFTSTNSQFDSRPKGLEHSNQAKQLFCSATAPIATMKLFSAAFCGLMALTTTLAQPLESTSANLQARDPEDVGISH